MDTPHVSLDEVIATELLERRVLRVRDAGAAARAMDELKRSLAGSPRRLLQRLAEVALELCAAQSAGVSLYEEDGGRCFCRWHAADGEYRHLLWSTLPCAFSPCGTVRDRQETLLMVDPQRHFQTLEHLQPAVAEVLLVPFTLRGEVAGALWVVSHEAASCCFEAEDRRIVEELTRFAAVAYEHLKSFGAEDVRQLSRLHSPGPEPEVHEEPGEPQ